jgi:hypothetical protein
MSSASSIWARFVCQVAISAGELLRTPLRQSSVGLGPMGQEFSGNGDVASRNALLHNGATNATRLRRSDS